MKFLARRLAYVLEMDNLIPLVASLVSVGCAILAGRVTLLRDDLENLAAARNSARAELAELRAELATARIEPDPTDDFMPPPGPRDFEASQA